MKVKRDQTSLSYRADSRTPEQFAADIKEGAAIENDIMRRYAQMHNLSYEELGHDSGEEIRAKSSSEADYLVEGKPLELKFCKPWNKEFKLKLHHVKSYIKQGAKILFVMGMGTDEPKYTIIDPKDVVDNKIVIFWHKQCVICKTKDFTWTTLE